MAFDGSMGGPLRMPTLCPSVGWGAQGAMLCHGWGAQGAMLCHGWVAAGFGRIKDVPLPTNSVSAHCSLLPHLLHHKNIDVAMDPRLLSTTSLKLAIQVLQ